MAVTDIAERFPSIVEREQPGSIELDPHRPGIERAKLSASGIPVWAVVGWVQAAIAGEVDGPVDPAVVADVAEAYGAPEDDVRAALAFYRLHRDAFEALFARNALAATRATKPV